MASNEYSSSQIDAYLLCPRRWWHKYVGGFREPGTKYQEWGLVYHKMAENYLRHGELPTIDSLTSGTTEFQCAKALLKAVPFLPKPTHPGLAQEARFDFMYDGVHFFGYKDYDAPDAVGFLTETPGTPFVGDHKTTSAFKWAKSSDELKHNTQAVMYACDLALKYDAPYVALNWVYSLRTGESCLPVRVIMTRTEIDAVMTDRVRIVHKIERARLATSAEHLEAKIDACYAFGGMCPFLGECNISPLESIGEHTMVDFNALNAMMNLPRTAPVAAQPVAAQPVAAQPVAAQPVAAQPIAAQPIAAFQMPLPLPPTEAKPWENAAISPYGEAGDPVASPEPKPVAVRRKRGGPPVSAETPAAAPPSPLALAAEAMRTSPTDGGPTFNELTVLILELIERIVVSKVDQALSRKAK